jgi:hypothetical protein
MLLAKGMSLRIGVAVNPQESQQIAELNNPTVIEVWAHCETTCSILNVGVNVEIECGWLCTSRKQTNPRILNGHGVVIQG